MVHSNKSSKGPGQKDPAKGPGDRQRIARNSPLTKGPGDRQRIARNSPLKPSEVDSREMSSPWRSLSPIYVPDLRPPDLRWRSLSPIYVPDRPTLAQPVPDLRPPWRSLSPIYSPIYVPSRPRSTSPDLSTSPYFFPSCCKLAPTLDQRREREKFASRFLSLPFTCQLICLQRLRCRHGISSSSP